jgi:hypothetical protein
MAISLPRIRREIAVVEDNKGPSLPFQQWLDIAFKQIESSVGRIELALDVAGVALDGSSGGGLSLELDGGDANGSDGSIEIDGGGV